VIHLPLGVVAQVREICHVFIAKLLDFHLFICVRPGVEVDFATLCVEWKVSYVDETFRVQTYLGHPRDHARV
jgi:hypothetical protein